MRRRRATIGVDVAVIGAGITGVTAAVLIKALGYTVALIDRGPLGGGDTGHTTAHLTAVTDRPFDDLEASLGDGAREVWDAGAVAIDRIERFVRAFGIRCGFARVPGYLHVRPGHPRAVEDAESLRSHLAACHRLGIDVAWTDRVAPFGVAGLRFDNQARLQPHRYLRALAAMVHGDGSVVHEHTNVTDLSGPPIGVHTDGVVVSADRLVIATHTPLQGLATTAAAALGQTRIALYTSYAQRGKVPKGRIPDALFWDTVNPYRYLRLDPTPGADYAILGGADHKTGQPGTEEPDAELREVLGGLGAEAADYAWSGQVVESIDGLPFIGESAPGQFSATGFGGNGMTFGTVAALMAADWVTGTASPWADLFAWSRTGLRTGGARTYLAENTDYPYYRIRDVVAGAASGDGGLGRGEGRIVDVDGRKVAEFRRPDGSVIRRSAVCTHMGCLVGWNDVEQTWDCPCHGSRFAPDGRVIGGPAESPLDDLDDVTPRVARRAGARG